MFNIPKHSTNAFSGRDIFIEMFNEWLTKTEMCFGASMVAHGHADAMVTGLTRSFGVNHEYITRVLDTKPGQRLMTCSLVLTRNNALFIADTNITEVPEPEVLADIIMQTATKAKAFGYEPRVALVSFSNFGYPHREHMQRIQEATKILDLRKVDFEYDGEMGVDVALDMSLRKKLSLLPIIWPCKYPDNAQGFMRQI